MQFLVSFPFTGTVSSAGSGYHHYPINHWFSGSLTFYHKVSEDQAGDQYDNGVPDHFEPHSLPFLFRQLSDLRCFQNNEDDRRRKEDEIGVDDKEIRRAAEHFPVGGRDRVSAGTQRRHQRGSDRDAGDDAVVLSLSGLSDNAGKTAEGRDQNVIIR